MTYLLIALLVLFVWCRIVWFELWEHLDRDGRSCFAHILNIAEDGHVPADLRWEVFKHSLFTSHGLIKDWYLGERPAPWVTDFLWEDFDESSD